MGSNPTLTAIDSKNLAVKAKTIADRWSGAADAVKVFLPHREGAKIASAALRKYWTFTNQVTAYAEGRGYVMLDQNG